MSDVRIDLEHCCVYKSFHLKLLPFSKARKVSTITQVKLKSMAFKMLF
jgi:hypothetical protein